MGTSRWIGRSPTFSPRVGARQQNHAIAPTVIRTRSDAGRLIHSAGSRLRPCRVTFGGRFLEAPPPRNRVGLRLGPLGLRSRGRRGRRGAPGHPRHALGRRGSLLRASGGRSLHVRLAAAVPCAAGGHRRRPPPPRSARGRAPRGERRPRHAQRRGGPERLHRGGRGPRRVVRSGGGRPARLPPGRAAHRLGGHGHARRAPRPRHRSLARLRERPEAVPGGAPARSRRRRPHHRRRAARVGPDRRRRPLALGRGRTGSLLDHRGRRLARGAAGPGRSPSPRRAPGVGRRGAPLGGGRARAPPPAGERDVGDADGDLPGDRAPRQARRQRRLHRHRPPDDRPGRGVLLRPRGARRAHRGPRPPGPLADSGRAGAGARLPPSPPRVPGPAAGRAAGRHHGPAGSSVARGPRGRHERDARRRSGDVRGGLLGPAAGPPGPGRRGPLDRLHHRL